MMKLQLRNRTSRNSSVGSGRVDDPPASLLKELTAAFGMFDKNGDGKISRLELGAVLRALVDDLKDSELDDLIRRVSGADDGFINLEQFISFHINECLIEESRQSSIMRSNGGLGSLTGEEDDLRSTFNVFDADRNGFISAEELQRVLWSLGKEHTSLDDCRYMINCVDKDGDQMVNFNEFRCLMSGSLQC